MRWASMHWTAGPRAWGEAGRVPVLWLWRAAAYLPFVVSPVTVAFGLLLLYPGWTASLPLLLAAYALLAYPFVARRWPRRSTGCRPATRRRRPRWEPRPGGCSGA
jgi:hypothetical protein